MHKARKMPKNCYKCGQNLKIYKKYVKNGWENYEKAWHNDTESDESIKAQRKEKEKWWIEKETTTNR